MLSSSPYEVPEKRKKNSRLRVKSESCPDPGAGGITAVAHPVGAMPSE